MGAVDSLAGGGAAGSARRSHGWRSARGGGVVVSHGLLGPPSIVSPLSANDSFLFQGGMNQSVTSAV